MSGREVISGHEILHRVEIGEYQCLLGKSIKEEMYVTWQCRVDAAKSPYWGHYSPDYTKAVKDFGNRVAELADRKIVYELEQKTANKPKQDKRGEQR